ncbi:MAG: protein kinase [Parachlamydiales bacterium]|jgi:serine/threonine protein kinase
MSLPLPSTAFQSTLVTLEPTSTFGPKVQYALQKALGKGGYTSVYKIIKFQETTGAAPASIPLAVKVFIKSKKYYEIEEIHKDYGWSFLRPLDHRRFAYPDENFYSEAEFQTRDQKKRIHLFVLPFFPGNPLKKYIGESKKSITMDWKKETALDLCALIEEMHQKNILHLDIKPENLILGEDGQMRLVDFDFSRPKNFPGLKTLGTRRYMAPEFFFNRTIKIVIADKQTEDSLQSKLSILETFLEPPDEKADIWSLLITLFYVFTGKKLMPVELIDFNINRGTAYLNLILADFDEENLKAACIKYRCFFFSLFQIQIYKQINRLLKDPSLIKCFFMEDLKTDPSLRPTIQTITQKINDFFPSKASLVQMLWF